MHPAECAEALKKIHSHDTKPLKTDPRLLRPWKFINPCEKYKLCGERVMMLEERFEDQRASL